MSDNISFLIKGIDAENNSLLVVPYSTSFKNSIEHYPLMNISLTSLTLSGDLMVQIANMCKPSIDTIILKESTKHINTIVSMLSSDIDTLNTTPVSAVDEYRQALYGSAPQTPPPNLAPIPDSINFVA
jgi:hypothetical protein